MLRTVLIENDKAFLDALANDLQSFCLNDIQILAKCSSPVEGLKAIKKFKPDLIFLDIEMPDMNGFEMLEILDKELTFEVVFITAFNNYAVQAFQISAVHYLLKPVSPEQLIDAVDRVKKKQVNKTIGQSWQLLIKNSQLPDRDKRVAIQNGKEYDLVAIKDIMYCMADGNYTKVFISGLQKPILPIRQIHVYEKLLPKYLFFRIHTSFLINRDYIKKYIRGDGGYVVMLNGVSLSVSRSCKALFLQWLDITAKED